MKSGKWLWLLGIGSLLGVAVGLQLWAAAPRGEPLLAGKTLAASLPGKLERGGAKDEPIAATEELKKAVGELLNFNDGIYRIYQLPEARVSVYAAWWEAGRMSPRLVAAHTPDVCWPANGWDRDRSAEVHLTAMSEELRHTGFESGELRVFTMQKKPEYVVFWHKVGDDMLSYETGSAPPWWAWLDEMRRGGLNLRKEQLFVRVSSDKPLESIWPRAEMAPLREALLALGLNASGKAKD